MDPVLVEFDVLKDFCGSFIIVPETRAERELFFFGYFILSVLDVKETSLSRQAGTADLIIFPVSWPQRYRFSDNSHVCMV
jgi:hypothetical protein